jgi:hypothetical protein
MIRFLNERRKSAQKVITLTDQKVYCEILKQRCNFSENLFVTKSTDSIVFIAFVVNSIIFSVSNSKLFEKFLFPLFAETKFPSSRFRFTINPNLLQINHILLEEEDISQDFDFQMIFRFISNLFTKSSSF